MLKALKTWAGKSKKPAASDTQDNKSQSKPKGKNEKSAGGNPNKCGKGSKSRSSSSNAQSNKHNHTKSKPRVQHHQKHQKKSADEDTWSLEQFVVPAEEGKVRFHDFDLHPILMQ